MVLNASAVSLQNLVNSGPFTVKLMATAQALDNVTTDKTNSSPSSSTVTVVSKSTVTTSMLDSADLLTLLENSLNTTFPSGSQLVVTRNGPFLRLYVADSTGTNIVQDVFTNLFLATIGEEQPVHAGSQTEISKSGNSGTSFSGNVVDTTTETLGLNYDDSGLTTRDGTHTKFNVIFLVTWKSSENLTNQQIKDSIKLQGVGNGTIRGQNVILQGSGSAAISGVLFTF